MSNGGGGGRTQIWVALIGSTAVIVAAVIGLFGGYDAGGGNGGEGEGPAPDPTPETTVQEGPDPTDWRDIVRIDEQWQVCPAAVVAPDYVTLEENQEQALAQLNEAVESGEFGEWPLAPTMEALTGANGHLALLRITSLLEEGNEQVDIENSVLASVLPQQAAPDHVDIVAVGQCGGAAEIRVFSPVPLSPETGETSTRSEGADYFFLKPKETETFRFDFPCQSPGTYDVELKLPYAFEDGSGNMEVENPQELVCPETATYWRYATFDGFTPPSVTEFAWNGTAYEQVP